MDTKGTEDTHISLEDFFDREAEHKITDKQKWRILARALEKIEAGEIGHHHCTENTKKEMLSFAFALLSTQTDSGRKATSVTVTEKNIYSTPAGSGEE